jgi:glycosyltransferase involved in cell wall biosynthesis
MKILTVTHVYPRTAGDYIAPFVENYQATLLKQGLEIIVLAPHAPGLLRTEGSGRYAVHRFVYAPERFERLAYHGEMHELVVKNVVNKVIFLSFWLSQFAALVRLVRRERPDLIHAHWWIPSGVVVALLSRMTGVPFVVTTHGTDVFIVNRFPFLRPLARFVFGNAARVQVISEYVGTFVARLIPHRLKRIDRVPMPIDEESFPRGLPRFRNRGSLLAIGRLIRRKGFSVLLDAFALLDSPSTLTLIGTGPEEECLKSQAKALGVADRIAFVRSVPPQELPRFFEKADILILPSVTDWKGEQEGLGMVLLESLWMGVPVICSDSGGMTDIVKDGYSGLLFPEGDSAALAAAIRKMSAEECYLRCLRGGQALYDREFAQAAIGERAAESYRKALGRRS